MPRDGSLRVLLVDDDDTYRTVLGEELRRRGYAASSAPDGQSALKAASEMAFDVILLDLRLPDMDGIEVLERLKAMDRAGSVVMLTGHGTIDTAIRAVRLGAADFLEKPCPIDRVEMTLQRTHERALLRHRQQVLEDGYSPPRVGSEFVGCSPAHMKLCRDIGRVAATPSTVLILGETGVGKEMAAKLTHEQSPRREAPFVVVDCAGLHEELLESELFGHEKGSFTGAFRQKHGLFEVASGGTIFLDEIGETSPDIQAKLLRVLETGRFRRVGGNREIAVDVRVISATNRDLTESIDRGLFRRDLYFRLATLTIAIPPLRDRRADVELLIEHFWKRIVARTSLPKDLAPEAKELLLQYHWPGNVRELIHVLEQAIVLADGEVVEPVDLPMALRASANDATPPPSEPLPLHELQRRHVLSVLGSVGGNRARAARALSISERNLYRLLKRYGVGNGANRRDDD